MAVWNVGICFHSLGLGAKFVLRDPSLFPWHLCIWLLLMLMKVIVLISKQVYKHIFCVSWQSAHASLKKRYILLPTAKRFFFKKFSFINMIVIPEHRSMRLSLLTFLFLNSSVSHMSPIKGNAMSLGCWPPEDSWDPMTILAFFCFSLLLQNTLTKLQRREILSGAWGFVACATFSEVCTYTGVLVCRWVWRLAKPRVLCQPLVPTVSLVPAGTSMWPYNRDQKSDSSWKLTWSSTGK